MEIEREFATGAELVPQLGRPICEKPLTWANIEMVKQSAVLESAKRTPETSPPIYRWDQ